MYLKEEKNEMNIFLLKLVLLLKLSITNCKDI